MFKIVIACSLLCAVLAANLDRDASILRQSADVNPDGSYQYAYDTSNGISAAESGLGGERAQGSYRWLSPEGQTVEINYVADENGFQPSGSAIPQPPPPPAWLARALAYIEANYQGERK